MPDGLWGLERILASDQPKGPLNSGLRLSRPGAEAWLHKGRRGKTLQGKESDRGAGNLLLGSQEDMVIFGCHWAFQEVGQGLESWGERNSLTASKASSLRR